MSAVRSRTAGEALTDLGLWTSPLPGLVPMRTGALRLPIHSYTKVLYR